MQKHGSKWLVPCECVCGFRKFQNFYELKRGRTRQCKRCAGIKRVARDKRKNKLAFIERCKKGGNAFRIRSKYGQDRELTWMALIMSGAKKRCADPNREGYGARGIKFLFPDVETAARWIKTNLGSRPTPKHSIDRIDNDGHYEPGNLRWATLQEQGRNKRYKPMNARVARLCAMRPEFSRETMYAYVRRGMSDTDILAHVKGKHGRPRKND